VDLFKKLLHFQEEDEESVKGIFYNEMYGLELDKGRWHQVILRSVSGNLHLWHLRPNRVLS